MAKKPFDPETAGLEDNYNPQMNAVTPSEPATEEEQYALDGAMITIKEFLYSEDGMANVVNVLNQGGELYESVPKVAVPILEKVHKEHPDAGGEIYFGEGGVIHQLVELLWEITEQEEMPGYQDDDQASGALINLYKKVGEYIQESADEQSIAEAQSLASEMVRTQEDGSVQDEESFRKEIQKDPGFVPLREQAQPPTEPQGLLG